MISLNLSLQQHANPEYNSIWNATTSERIMALPIDSMMYVVFFSQSRFCRPAISSSGSASLSRDHRYLAVSNLSTDIAVYDLRTRAIQMRWDNESNVEKGKLCLPVKFLHRDHAVFSGSSCGSIKLWGAYTRGHQK